MGYLRCLHKLGGRFALELYYAHKTIIIQQMYSYEYIFSNLLNNKSRKKQLKHKTLKN